MKRKTSPKSAPKVQTAAVVGLGYVGLPLLVEIASAGIRALGVDLDASKVATLNRGGSYIDDVPAQRVAGLSRDGTLRATTDFAAVASADALSICVPTPLRKTKDPDLSYIVEAVDRVAPHLKPGALVILESTTYPGTTEELVLPRLEAGGRRVGRDFFLAFSPERTDPGNPIFKTKNTPKVLGGQTPACSAAARAYYERVFDRVVMVSSPRAAEMVKLLENTYRAVNIGMVNEVAQMCHRLGLDVWEIIDAAATKPFGFQPFYPGPGLGGHCIPIDPLYLSWKLRSLNYMARFIELASEVNTSMPRYVVDRLLAALNRRGRAMKGARILILGMAYKKNVSDYRESPAIDVALLLKGLGARVEYHDPHVPSIDEHGLRLRSRRLTPSLLDSSDAVVVITNHDAVDYDLVRARASFVFDARNALKKGRPGRLEKL